MMPYALCLFISSLFLFMIQPIVGKILLPLYGGSTTVWAICLLFFQMVLFLGYFYSHLITTKLPIKIQIAIHSLLLLFGLIFTPYNLLDITPEAASNTTTWSLFAILIKITIPILGITAHSTLLQIWFMHSKNKNKSPYKLYGISNLGCLFSILFYIFIVQPYLGAKDQVVIWNLGYLLIIILVIWCAYISYQNTKTYKSSVLNSSTQKNSYGMTYKRVWILEAAAVSALLCALTTYLSTYIASAPLIWVIPLGIYLLSIIITVSYPNYYLKNTIERLWSSCVTISIVFYLLGHYLPVTLTFMIHLITFTLISFGLHTQVFRTKPAVSNLSSFYLFFSLGGCIGTLFSGIIAPSIFSSYFEFPITLVIARFLFRASKKANNKVKVNIKKEIAILFLYIASVYLWESLDPKNILKYFSLDFFLLPYLPPIIAIILLKTPKRMVLGLLCLLLFYTHKSSIKNTLYHNRSFFSPIIVKKSANSYFHELVNGDIVHGRQDMREAYRHIPLSYYHKGSGAGRLFSQFGSSWSEIGAVGLGIGALSAYVKPNQSMTFFEIDSMVVRIAENEKYFTFVNDARKKSVEIKVILGDARLNLNRIDTLFDAIFIDAFQSSAIPVHLLTLEAFQIYMNHLKKDGFLAIHIPNEYLDFESLLAVQAKQLGLKGWIYHDKGEEAQTDPSTWVVLLNKTDGRHKVSVFFKDWLPLVQKKEISSWSDDHNNIFALW